MGADIDKLDTSEYLDYIQRVDDKIRGRGINPFYHPDWIFSLLGFKKEMENLTNKLHAFTRDLITKRRPIFESSPSRIKSGTDADQIDADNMYVQD